MKRCSLTYSSPFAIARIAALLAALSLVMHTPAPANDLADRGQALAERLCASCHAIGRGERSPIASAPAFRRIEPRVDLEQMVERLQDGLIAGHPEMPVFILKDDEARGLVAYMKSLRDL